MLIDDTSLTDWRRDGWLHLPRVFDVHDVERLRAAVEELASWAEVGAPGLHHFEQTDGGPVVARSEHFADEHDHLGSVLRSGLVPGVLEALLDEPAVLFKEKVNYKYPGGGGFAPHQDAAAYRFVDHHVSVMIPIDPATIESGCLWFAPGYEAGQLDTDARGRLTDEVAASLDWRSLEVDPGDIVVFDSYAPHRSDTNRSSRPRRALYLTYNRASLGDHRDRYYADKLAEFDSAGHDFDGERVRISISDDFLGRPVVEAAGTGATDGR